MHYLIFFRIHCAITSGGFIGIPRNSLSFSKSLSLLTMNSALPAMAASRNMLSVRPFFTALYLKEIVDYSLVSFREVFHEIIQHLSISMAEYRPL